MILPNFTVTDEVSTGDKAGSVKVNEYEIVWNLVGDLMEVEVFKLKMPIGFICDTK